VQSGVVGPRTAHRAEHVAAHDPRAEVVEPAFGKVVVGAGGAALAAVQFLEHARGHQPAVHLLAANAERVLATLIHPGAITVE
jgi:hypothetical protein